MAGDVTFAQVGSGPYRACGSTGGGGLYCWGGSATEGVGRGLALGIMDLPESGCPDRFGGDTWNCAREPIQVPADIGFAGAEAGVFHACGLDESGAAYCWGNNEAGQFGDGTTDSARTLVRVVE